MSATGIEDVGEMIEAFQLGGEPVVFCDHASVTLRQIGDGVLYRHALSEVSIPRGAYDRLTVLVTGLIGDHRVDAAFQATYSHLVQKARAAAWDLGHIES